MTQAFSYSHPYKSFLHSYPQTPGRKHVFRGELALAWIIVMNSLAVVLMLHSGSGISAISSVPYAFSAVLPQLSLGTWNYIFQGTLVAVLMLLKKKFVPQYLFSFIVGFGFGKMMDIHKAWVNLLPNSLSCRILCFFISYLLICFGIALSNRCQLPIIPTDLFPRDLAEITGIRYSRIKISFDIICVAVTAAMTWIFLGRIDGLGIGTIIGALTMGRVIGRIGDILDRHVKFVSVLTPRPTIRRRIA